MNNKLVLKILLIVLLSLDLLFILYYAINFILSLCGVANLTAFFSILTYIVVGINIVALVVLLVIYFTRKTK